MNIRYILPFIESTQGAFHELFHLQPEAMAPYLVRKEEILEKDICGIINVLGEAKGLVVVSFPAPVAKALTALLTGRTKDDIDEDVTDTVGELVNIIAGNAKRGLEEFRLQISLPSVIQGGGHQMTWPSGPVPVITVPFSTTKGSFSLSVGLENFVTG